MERATPTEGSHSDRRGPAVRRRRSKRSYELLACGLHGHVLVGTDAAELRPGDRAVALEQDGFRWHRCLRCDSWLPQRPPGSPTRQFVPERDEIVIPARGKALRDRFVLRLIALDRAFHFLILALLGIGILVFASKEQQLRGPFYRILANIQRGVGGGPIQNEHVGILGDVNKAFSVNSHTLYVVGAVVCAYAVLEGVEAVGLWLEKRWAEYLTFVATTVFLPLEVWEMAHRLTAVKLIAFIINLAVVVYLIYAKRLFGLRGGGAAERRERGAEMDWPALERALPFSLGGEPLSAPARSV